MRLAPGEKWGLGVGVICWKRTPPDKYKHYVQIKCLPGGKIIVYNFKKESDLKLRLKEVFFVNNYNGYVW